MNFKFEILRAVISCEAVIESELARMSRPSSDLPYVHFCLKKMFDFIPDGAQRQNNIE